MKKLTSLFCLFLTFQINSTAQNKAVGDTTIWDTINFETIEPDIFIDTASSNIWQVGPPQKIFFNSALSGNQAIVTDTFNPYPANNLSYFELAITQSNCDWFPNSILIEINHKYDTDTLKDGGFITISHDNGDTWGNIIENYHPDFSYQPSDLPPAGMYTTSDTLANGEYGFSGNSGGWITNSFFWVIYPLKNYHDSDTMLLRFNYYSDSINNSLEGWMIDEITISSIELASSIQEQSTSAMVKVLNNPISNQLQLEIEEPFSKGEIKLYTIGGKQVFTTEIFGNTSPNIPLPYLAKGSYILKVQLDDEPIESKKIIKN